MKKWTLSLNDDGGSIVTIDGKSIVLDEAIWDEILELLHKTVSKAAENPFTRALYGKSYYYIDDFGRTDNTTEVGHEMDDKYYSNVNYFQKESIARQVALHQLLNRKLLKFTYDNNCVDTAKWDENNPHWFIYYNNAAEEFEVGVTHRMQFSTTFFPTEAAAERAIKEVIKPFVMEHPEFVWRNQ